MRVELLNWDTDFFGWKTGSVRLKSTDTDDLNDILELAYREHFRLVYVFTDRQTVIDQKLLTAYHGWLADTKVVFRKEPVNHGVDKSVEVCEAVESDTDLEKLAFLSGRHSRFLTDQNIPDDFFYRMYSTWIRRSVHREIADSVYIVREDNQTAGMATLKINGDVADIGLIAVDEKFQGRGCGKRLIQACESETQKKGAGLLSVATQLDNRQACDFYRYCGFQLHEMTNIYHFWL